MTSKYLLTLFLLPASLFLNAQFNYKEGNVITNNGNTIKGFINYKEWHKNPDRILFRTAPDKADARVFAADSIAGFNIPGYESYARFIVQVSMDEIMFGSLKEVMDTSTETKAVFLKEILKGDRINLYEYTDEIKVRYYILDKRQTTPYELVYRKLLKDNREITQELYKQQLTTLASGYAVFNTSVEDRILKATYSGKDIKNIISKINTQNETSNSIIIDKKKGWNFFVGIGITRGTMNYTGENLVMVDGLDDMGGYKFKNKITTHSYLPLVTAGADFYINPAIRRLVIRTEITAENIKSTVKSHYKFNIYSADESDYTYQFSSWNIGFRPQLIYNLYNTPEYKWYLAAGVSFNYLANSDNSLERRDRQPGNVIDVREDYFQLKEFTMNAIVRSGLRINDRFDLSLIWASPVEYTDYAGGTKSTKTSLVSFSVSYSLKK